MAERFERLFQLQGIQHIEDSPIIICAGALLKDCTSGSIITQLKLQSVAEKRIKAAKISLAAYDVAGTELQGVADYQYLELNVSEGQDFGSNKAIVMPDPVTRSFKITSAVIVFSDGGVWESTLPFMTLPTPQHIHNRLKEAELEKQYRIETTSESNYVPQESSGLWQCSCGHWNGGNKCTNCKENRENVFSALELPYLTDRMNHRLEQERLQYEAELARQAQLAAEAEAKRKSMRKRLKVVIPVVLVSAIIIGICSALYIKSKELTIEKLLALRTREDVITLLGTTEDNKSSDYQAVKFFKETFEGRFYYKENDLTNWRLSFLYPGYDNIDNLSSKEELSLQNEASSAAISISHDVVEDFTAKLGGPELTELDCGCIVFKWIVNDRMIELYDRSNHVFHSSIGSVFEIQVNCDHQSFCKHTDIKEEAVDATCTVDGYLRRTCTICGYTEEEIYAAFGHTLSTSVTKEATCSESGEEVSICSVCGDKETKSIESIPHTYETKITKNATCTAEGSQVNTCSVCGNSYEEVIPTIAHSYIDTVIEAATCTNLGTKTQKCSVCGHSANSVSIQPLGHDYGQYAIDEATCTTDGARYMKCTRCGDEYTIAIDAFGHSWKDATCTKEKHCISCGLTSGTPLGHDWVDPGYGDPYCSVCYMEYTPQAKFIVKNLPSVTRDGFGDSTYTISVTSMSVLDFNLHIDYYGNMTICPQFDLCYEVTSSNQDCFPDDFYIDITIYNSAGEVVYEGSASAYGLLGEFNDWVYTHTEMPEGDTYYINLNID